MFFLIPIFLVKKNYQRIGKPDKMVKVSREEDEKRRVPYGSGTLLL